MNRLKPSEWQALQRIREQQTGRFSLQEMAIFGSNFDANQRAQLHDRELLTQQPVLECEVAP